MVTIITTIMKELYSLRNIYLYFFDSELIKLEFFFIAIFSGALLSFFIFLLFWLTNQNAILKSNKVTFENLKNVDMKF